MADTPSIAVKDTIVAREVGGEMVLLDLEAGTYFGLNAVGARIWAALGEAPQTQAALTTLIAAEFDAEEAVIAQDIAALLADLQTNGLVDITA
ncbi:PqqD family protein [Erythrobacter sp. EC-HK427]|uniref:PqqD family protein n=1 Tax=Erythrobacter sp. EC-HK427 TaxID=2038396 RepID=UPI00125BF748|nr:PqqD family protein [Erythrobacter sp. EC-HK427]VVT02241.1 conserved hypothetical protein [Erythrobacter sp. EC-HK427]